METFTVESGPMSALLDTGAPADWRVVHLFGREAMNELSLWELDVVLPRWQADQLERGGDYERSLLAQAVTLGVGDEPVERAAIVTAVSRLWSDPDDDEVALRLTLRERPWLCAQRRDTRIFQNLYPHEIISQVLAAHGVRHRWVLRNTYPARVYCTQYEETDWEFVTRLMAEEGIAFFFEHRRDFAGADAPGPRDAQDELREPIVPGTGAAGPGASGDRVHDVLSFTDAAGAFPVAPDRAGSPAVLPRTEEAGMAGESVFALRPQRTIRPSTLQFRDYDPMRPLLTLAADAVVADAALPPENPGIALDVYEHHGEYEIPDVADENAQVHLEQYRRHQSFLAGESNSPLLRAGHVIAADGTWLVTEVQHVALPAGQTREPMQSSLVRGCVQAIREAQGSEVDEERLRAIVRAAIERPSGAAMRFHNNFEALPMPAILRPPRPRRTLRATTETATVVGPRDTAIHCDRYGRVKVQFHWDRQGRFDEGSSCWIRVAHPWAGTGFGHQFIPRVGMEVVVTFIGGDPDRPVIIGSVYNRTHPLPETPPEHAARSGFRTQSVPGGKGFNELSFDDSEGIERLYLKAQKDLVAEVGDELIFNVQGDESHQVLRDQRDVVGRHHIEGIGRNEARTVGGHAADFVRGDRTHHVARNTVDRVDGTAQRVVRGMDLSASAEDRLDHVAGHHTTVIGGSRIEQVGGADDRGDDVRYVEGRVFTTAGQGMVLRVAGDGSSPGLRLVCGDSEITLTPDRIVLQSPHVEVRGLEETVVSGKRGTLVLDGAAKLYGRKVLLRRPSALPKGGPGTSIELTDTAITMEADAVSMIAPTPHGSPRYEPAEGVTDRAPITLRLSHLEGRDSWEDLDGVRFRAVVEGDDDALTAEGEIHEGTVSGGTVTLDAPAGARRVLLTVYVEEHPELSAIYARPLSWAVEIVDELPPVTSIRGARVALRNLGYATGEDDDALDDVTRQALRRFQGHKGVPITGALDEPTLDALRAAQTGLPS